MRNNCEAVSVTIRLNKHTVVRICGVYRSPNYKLSSIVEFINEDFPIVCAAPNNVSDVILLGDININIMDNALCRMASDYLNMLASLGFVHYIEEATRLESRSCIDHIVVKSIKLNVLETTVTPRADHCAIQAVFQYTDVKPVIKKTNKNKSTTIYDKHIFKKHMFQHDWSEFFGLTDAEEACDYLVTKSIQFQELSTRIVRSKKMTKKLKPWLSHKLLKNYRTLAKTPFCREMRNSLRQKVREEKQKYFKKKFSEAGQNSKKRWDIINNDLRGKRKKKTNISEIMETKDVECDQSRLDIINNHLAKIGKKIAESVGRSKMQDNLEHKQQAYTRFQFDSPSAASILRCMKLLKKSNAIGHDGIRPNLIRECKQLVCILLEHLFKLCFNDGVFPRSFKIAVVTPLHKGGVKCIDNLRPISVPCFLGKILEKCMQLQLSEYFERNEMISEFQFGFKRGSRTEDAVQLLQHFATSTLEANQIPLVIFLDLRKCFDTISRQRLLRKLKLGGICNNSLKLLTSFLEDRRQILRYNGLSSYEEKVEYGLPQGSLLSPSLFNFFINDIHELCDNSLKLQFADDTALCYAMRNLDDIKFVSRNFSIIRDYLNLNLLSLNVLKTKILVFKQRGFYDTSIIVHECDDYEDVTCVCPRIKNSRSAEYLGVVIQDDLKWNGHIDKVMKKLRSTGAVIRSVRDLVDHQVLRTIYFSLFESHIHYCLLVYGGARASLLESVFKMQKKVLRIMNNVDKRYHSKELFEKENVKNIYYLYTCKLLDFFKRNSYIFFNDQVPSHVTRQSKKFKNSLSVKYQTSEQTAYFKILRVLNKFNVNDFEFSRESFPQDIRNLKKRLYTLSIDELKELIY